jgi:radical SAM superfamily enzyme
LYGVDEYIDLCIDFRKRLNPDFVIERFVSQSPAELLLIPGWGRFTFLVLKNFTNKGGYTYGCPLFVLRKYCSASG